MEIGEYQLNQMLEEVAEHADGWDKLLEMVAEADTPANRQELYAYLEYLIPRIKHIRLAFNWVSYDTQDRIWSIHNYDFKMFQYMRRRYPDEIVVTPQCISIRAEALSYDDRDKLHRQLGC